jgi:DNA-binding NtrC family response regulator
MNNIITQATPASALAQSQDRIEERIEDRIGIAPEIDEAMTAAPFALVIDDQEAVCRTLAMLITGLGVESATYQSAKLAIASLDQRRPELIFLDIALEQGDAIDVLKALSEKRDAGVVQIMSGGRLALLEAVQRMGARYGLALRPPLQKPFRAAAIREVIVSLGLAPESAEIAVPAIDEGWLD